MCISKSCIKPLAISIQ